MTQARSWLPKEAFSEAAVKAGLHDIVAGWSSRWFARAAATISAARPNEHAPLAAAQSLSIRGSAATLEMTARAKRRLLEAILDVDLSTQVLADGDRRLLDLLASKAAHDLVAHLDRNLGAAAIDDAASSIIVTVSVGLYEILEFGVADQVIVPLIKASYPSTVGKSASHLSRRSDALRRMPIRAKGVVGNAELQIAEFRELGVGDVVILDRALGESVELRLAESGGMIASGKLRRNAGQVSIQL